MPTLPLDVHIAIVTLLPPSRCRFVDDTSIRTLIEYSRASSLLREASFFPAVWKPHYHARYRHNDLNSETLRIAQYARNWRLMYCERRRIDRNALELLRDITLSRTNRNDKAVILSKMGRDVWDVLDIERTFLPSIRSPPTELPYALTQHFWAKRILETMARRETVDVWATLLPDADVAMDDRASFEQTMLGLSSFLGHSMHDMTQLFDNMEARCRVFIRNKGLTLDAESPLYNVPEVCKVLCQFMATQGFGPSNYQTFLDVTNNFPHAYLATNRRTLPIGLVHVFVSLARRIGLDASPVNFPQKVLCHVRSPKEGGEPYHIDTYVAGSNDCIVQMQDLLRYLSNHIPGVPQTFLPGYLNPVDPFVMLLRAANNIRRSRWHNSLPYDIAQSYQFLEAVIHMMFFDNIDVLAQELGNLELRPMDCATFLLDKLAPLLSIHPRTLLEIHCERTRENEALEAAMVQRRGTQAVRYFVGLPFRHRKNDYVACIIHWDTSCEADENWIERMGVDDLDRGRHQPFYKSLVLDQEATQRYVAEENIEAVLLSEHYIEQFFETHATLAKHFQSVQVEETSENSKRWRFVLSPEATANYPEDDAIASAWVKEGALP